MGAPALPLALAAGPAAKNVPVNTSAPACRELSSLDNSLPVQTATSWFVSCTTRSVLPCSLKRMTSKLPLSSFLSPIVAEYQPSLPSAAVAVAAQATSPRFSLA
jgi:hypothetical protein